MMILWGWVKMALWIGSCSANWNHTQVSPHEAFYPTDKQNHYMVSSTYPDLGATASTGAAIFDVPTPPIEVMGLDTTDDTEPSDRARLWKLWWAQRESTRGQTIISSHLSPMGVTNAGPNSTNANSSIKPFETVRPHTSALTELVETHSYSPFTSTYQRHLLAKTRLRATRSAVWSTPRMTKPTSTPWSPKTSSTGNWTHPPLEPTTPSTEVPEDTTPDRKTILIICILALLIVVLSIGGSVGTYQQMRAEEEVDRRTVSLTPSRRTPKAFSTQVREAGEEARSKSHRLLNYIISFGSPPPYVTRAESVEMIDMQNKPSATMADDACTVSSYPKLVRTQADIDLCLLAPDETGNELDYCVINLDADHSDDNSTEGIAFTAVGQPHLI